MSFIEWKCCFWTVLQTKYDSVPIKYSAIYSQDSLLFFVVFWIQELGAFYVDFFQFLYVVND